VAVKSRALKRIGTIIYYLYLFVAGSAICHYIFITEFRNTHNCITPVDVFLKVPEVFRFLLVALLHVKEVEIVNTQYHLYPAIPPWYIVRILVCTMPDVHPGKRGHVELLQGMLPQE
jgi:hypothetical protein